jgi:hypothetical protein
MSVTAYDSRQGVGTLTLGATEYGYQAAAVRLTPNVNSNDGTPTLAVPEPAPDSVITWALNIDAIQDFENPTGLVNFLMDNALSEVAFVWTPLTEAGVVYSGTVQVLPMGSAATSPSRSLRRSSSRSSASRPASTASLRARAGARRRPRRDSL